MKMNWILLFSLCLFALKANAEQSVVIDAQSVGQSPSATNAGANGAASSDSVAEANAANKERILKGGKMSRREQREMDKAAMADTNLQAGSDFLATNKTKPGVVTLASGVQYKILKAGTGNKKPTENSSIRCRYTGSLIDGSTIDKSDAKKPVTLRVEGFVQGLKEAVTLMPTGSKWEIVIPPQLAYGARGYHAVGPNAVVIYEMEILGIK
jgi:FKBP-type peptidyl-prolyl cis-trans isomerase FklB